MSGPRSVRHVDLPAGAEGWLVIDRTVRGRAFGGLRIVGDGATEADPVAALVAAARVMTLKYGFARFALGGAKAALRVPGDDGNPGDPRRRGALRAFGAALRREIGSGEWLPGVDMAACRDDLDALFEGAGRPGAARGWLDRSNVYTAWSVFAALRAGLVAAGVEERGARVALQGFGRVGTVLAARLHAAGMRVVALSTRDGGLHDPAGLDVPALCSARERSGDRFLRAWTGGGASIAATDALLVPCEAAVPAAQSFVLDAETAPALQARVVACAANAPFARAVERALGARGILVLPDFVANVGGVVGSVLERAIGQAALEGFIAGRVGERVLSLIEQGRRDGRCLGDLAEEDALRFLDRAERGGGAWPAGVFRRAVLALPRGVREVLVLGYARRRVLVR